MKKTPLLFITLLPLFLISCVETENDILEMRVSHYRQIGYGFFGPRISYVIQVEDQIGGEEWSSTSGVTGFEYEWGYTYDILVVKEYFNYDEPVADAPSFRFVLLKELSNEKVDAGTEFEIILQRVYDDGTVESFIEGNRENSFKILSQKDFDCANLCDELTKEREPSTYLTGTFQHTESGDIKLVGLRNEDMVKY